MIDRRALLSGSAAALAGISAHRAGTATLSLATPLLDDIERLAFNFFWERVNPLNGLMPDRWPTRSPASIAAVGFALTAYPIGVERGWITRAGAAQRTLATLRFFASAPSGKGQSGIAGHKGFFYHFLDVETGERFRKTELSTVDSSLLFLGMLFAAAWFDRDDPTEREIRTLGTEIVERADWRWFKPRRSDVSMGWHPERGFITRGWEGYNEGMMVYILGLGATRHALPDASWDAWTAPYAKCWRGEGETRHLAFAPLFGHQYSHMWIDFRGIADAPMRAAGFDYFENSRRATWANRAYCIANPMRWDGYSRDIWGLTACDGPASRKARFNGETRHFHGYSARGPLGQPDERDDGTLAPTAAIGSLAFAPEICVPAAEAMRRFQGGRLYGQYGFLDAFNPSYRFAGAVETGATDRERGWVATDYLGIDQGAILGAIANHRDGMIWRTMQKSSVIRRGLTRAGFTGGWLD